MDALSALTDLLDTLAGSPWTYLAILAIAAGDVLFPVLPSETTVILGGVLAATGDLHVAGVIATGAAGAMLGDNVAYGLGRVFGTRAAARLAGGPKGQRMLGWAQHQLAERGGTLIVSSRFIPGGRTAATLTAGMLEMPWRRFLAFDVAAGLVWATYATLLGFFGGKAFHDDPAIAIAVAIVATVVIGGLIELIRARRRPAALTP